MTLGSLSADAEGIAAEGCETLMQFTQHADGAYITRNDACAIVVSAFNIWNQFSKKFSHTDRVGGCASKRHPRIPLPHRDQTFRNAALCQPLKAIGGSHDILSVVI